MSDLLDALTALGTVAAAGAAALGLRAANRTAATAERQLAAQWQPLLVDVPNDRSRHQSRSIRLPNGQRVVLPERAGDVAVGDAIVQVTGDAGEYVVVNFRNIGGGAATILDVTLFVDRSQMGSSWRVEHPLLGTNESSRAVVALASDEPERGRFADCARRLGGGFPCASTTQTCPE